MKWIGLPSLLPVIVLVVGRLSCGVASGAPVLANGGFESPAVASFTAGGGDDWTSTGDAYLVPNSAGYGETPYGAQFLSLNGYADTPTSDAQTVTGFTAGTTYFLGVDFADLLDSDPSELTITLSGAFDYSQTFSAPVDGNYGSATIPFQSASVFFTPLTSGSITITLSNPSPGAIAIDNVGLYSNVSPPVPEPTTVSVMLLGAATALTLRRKWQA
jgi:hypothetical protein